MRIGAVGKADRQLIMMLHHNDHKRDYTNLATPKMFDPNLGTTDLISCILKCII